jgi:hypothetical protein
MENSQLMEREIGGNGLISAFQLVTIMLTLDRTTLFYFSLMQTSDQKSQYGGLISSWAAGVNAGRARSKASSKPCDVRSIPDQWYHSIDFDIGSNQPRCYHLY